MQTSKQNTHEPKKEYSKVAPPSLSEQAGLEHAPQSVIPEMMGVKELERDFTDGAIPAGIECKEPTTTGPSISSLVAARATIKLHELKSVITKSITEEPARRGTIERMEDLGPLFEELKTSIGNLMAASDIATNIACPVTKIPSFSTVEYTTKDGVLKVDTSSLLHGFIDTCNTAASMDTNISEPRLIAYESMSLPSVPHFYPGDIAAVCPIVGNYPTDTTPTVTDYRKALAIYNYLRYHLITTRPYSDEMDDVVATARSMFTYCQGPGVDMILRGARVHSVFPRRGAANGARVFRALGADDLVLYRRFYTLSNVSLEALTSTSRLCPDMTPTFRKKDSLRVNVVAQANQRPATNYQNMIDTTSVSEAQSLCQTIYSFITAGYGVFIDLSPSINSANVLDYIAILFALSIFDRDVLNFSATNDMWDLIKTIMLYFYPGCYLRAWPGWGGQAPAPGVPAAEHLPRPLAQWIASMAAGVTRYNPPIAALPPDFGIGGIFSIVQQFTSFEPAPTAAGAANFARLLHLSDWISTLSMNRNATQRQRVFQVFTGVCYPGWHKTLYALMFCAQNTPRCTGLCPDAQPRGVVLSERKTVTLTTQQLISGMFLWSEGDPHVKDNILTDPFVDIIDMRTALRRVSALNDLKDFLSMQRDINDMNMSWLNLKDAVTYCLAAVRGYFGRLDAAGTPCPAQFKPALSKRIFDTLLYMYLDLNADMKAIWDQVVKGDYVATTLIGSFDQYGLAFAASADLNVLAIAYGFSDFQLYLNDITTTITDPLLSYMSAPPNDKSYNSDLMCSHYLEVYDAPMIDLEMIIARGSNFRTLSDGLFLVPCYDLGAAVQHANGLNEYAVVDPRPAAFPNAAVINLADLENSSYLAPDLHSIIFASGLASDNYYTLPNGGYTPLRVKTIKLETDQNVTRGSLAKQKFFDPDLNKNTITPRTDSTAATVVRSNVSEFMNDNGGTPFPLISAYYSGNAIIPYYDINRINRTRLMEVINDYIKYASLSSFTYTREPLEHLPWSMYAVKMSIWERIDAPAAPAAGAALTVRDRNVRHQVAVAGVQSCYRPRVLNSRVFNATFPPNAFNPTYYGLGIDDAIGEPAYHLLFDPTVFQTPPAVRRTDIDGHLLMEKRRDEIPAGYSESFSHRSPVSIFTAAAPQVSRIALSDLKLGSKIGDSVSSNESTLADQTPLPTFL